MPRYEILGNGVRIFFKALKSALIDENSENVGVNVQENVHEKSRTDLILDVIRENNAISLKELAQKIGVASKTIQRDLGRLKSENVIRRIGPDKGGYWQIMKDS